MSSDDNVEQARWIIDNSDSSSQNKPPKDYKVNESDDNGRQGNSAKSPPRDRRTFVRRDFLPPPVLDSMPPTWFKAKPAFGPDPASSDSPRAWAQERRSPSPPPASRNNLMPLPPPSNISPPPPSPSSLTSPTTQAKGRQKFPSALVLVASPSMTPKSSLPSPLSKSPMRISHPQDQRPLSIAPTFSTSLSPPIHHLSPKTSWSDQFIDRLITKSTSIAEDTTNSPVSPRPPQEIVLDSPLTRSSTLRSSMPPSKLDSTVEREGMKDGQVSSGGQETPTLWLSSKLRAERGRAVNKGLAQLLISPVGNRLGTLD